MSDRSAKDLLKLRREKHRAKIKGDLKEFASFCNLIGELLVQSGNYEDALLEHKEELETCELLCDDLGIAIAHRKIGEVFSELGQYEEALEHQRKHLTLARRLKNSLEVQRALATVGRTYYFKAEALGSTSGEYETALSQARESFEESLAVCQSLGDSVPKREKMEMLARLFLNLGLVYDHQGNRVASSDSLKKAIFISDKYQLTEDLHRCYYALAGIYQRSSQLSQALRYAELAAGVARKLKDKALLCDDLALKAQLFFTLRDFEAAKRYLVRAHKEKSPISEDRLRIEQALKDAVRICRLQGRLAATSDSNHRELIQLNEKLGDLCSKVKSFSAALNYYQQMLKEAECLAYNEKRMIPIYVSLSQTYMDLKDYEKAVVYFEKELDCYADNPSEMCRTLLNIANAHEENGASYAELERIYDRAIQLGESGGNHRLHAEALNSLAVLQESNCLFREAERTRVRLRRVCEEHGIDLDSRFESSSQGSNGSEGDEESDEDLLENLSDEDSEDESGVLRTRKRQPKDLEKRNMKGETPLHRACIKQDIRAVTQLIAQGHQVNVRDYCGWSPLHEACNHGNVEIVELLLKNGAAVNDRGGSECEGVTPLHDAASCGHTDVIRVLLRYGANPVARTDAGETPYECLVKWRLRTCGDLDSRTLSDCLKVEAKLKESLEKVGLKVPSEKDIERSQLQTSALIPEEEVLEEDSPQILPPPARTPSAAAEDPKKEYSSAIRAVGLSAARRLRESSPSPVKATAKRKSGPLVPEDVDADDWLVDDLGSANRKTKSRKQLSDWPSCRSFKSSRPLIGHAGSGSDNDELEDTEPIRTLNKKCKTSAFDWPSRGNFENDDVTASRSLIGRSGSGWNDDSLRSKDLWTREKTPRKTNSSMTARPLELRDDDWLDRDVEGSAAASLSSPLRKKMKPSIPQVDIESSEDEGRSSPVLQSCARTPLARRAAQQQSIRSFTKTGERCRASGSILEPGPSFASAARDGTSVLRLRIRIEGRLLLVPISSPESKSVGWLCSETARRYYSLTGLRPILTLSTKDGALLSVDDPLTLVIGSDEEILAQVNAWDLPSLQERYANACRGLNVVCYKNIETLMQSAQALGVLKLAGFSLGNAALLPIFRALQCQQTLREVDLSRNKMDDAAFTNLCTALITLPLLKRLDLSSNCITAAGLQQLAAALKDTKPVLKHLEELVLSFNPLGDAGVDSLATVVHKLVSLRQLRLESCFLGPGFLQQSSLMSALQASPLAELHLGYNKFTPVVMETLYHVIMPPNLELLSLPGIPQACEAFGSYLARLPTSQLGIRQLCFSRCLATDASLQRLASTLDKLPRLNAVNVKDNPQITLRGLSYFLEKALEFGVSLEEIYVSGCQWPSKWNSTDVEAFVDLLERYLRQCGNFKSLEIHKDADGAIESMLHRVFGDSGGIVRKIGKTVLSYHAITRH